MNSRVPKLEELALQVSFQDVLNTLNLSYDHRPEGKRFPHLLSSVMTTNSFFTSENIRSLVRSRLDQHLVGTMSDKIRQKYVELFFKHLSEKKNEDITLVDIWVFLDAILDEHFLELKAHVAFPGCEPSSQLISTIGQQSPNLEKLTLKFRLMKKDCDVEKVIQSLSALEKLTDLCLTRVDTLSNSAMFNVMSLIGDSCPSLTKLAIKRNRGFRDEDVLALILGKRIDALLQPAADNVPDWCDTEEKLQHLVMPLSYRSPICSSLTELDFGSFGCTITVAVLILRHFPAMLKMDVGDCSTALLAIMVLHDAKEKSRDCFSLAIEDAAQRHPELFPAPSVNANCYGLKGPLFITKLDRINVKHREMLLAVRSMCPMLQEVEFSKRTELELGTYEELESPVLPDELESMLNGWPKLKVITITSLSLKYVKPILRTFGETLQHLKLNFCNEKKDKSSILQDLTRCHLLESLSFYGSQLYSDDESLEGTGYDVDSFLPNLKCLKGTHCLASLSKFFEQKPNLKELQLRCFHLGLENGKHQLEWSIIHHQWSQLKTLRILDFPGFSLEMVANLIARLKILKEVALPLTIVSHGSKTINDIQQELAERNPTVEIHLFNFRGAKPCKWCLP